MRSFFILSLLILLIATKSTAQIPLLINNHPNKEINQFIERKSLNYLKVAYDSFITARMQDSFYRTIFNLNKKNTNFNKFKVYIILAAYYKNNIDEWRTSDKDIIDFIEIDTSTFYCEAYFQKGKSTYIIASMYYPNKQHFDFVSDDYFTDDSKLNTTGINKDDKRFYKYILKASPDNIFIISGYPDLICFQKGTKVYFYNHHGNQVQSLNYYKN